MCWMLRDLEELTQLLLLYYLTYCSLDLKIVHNSEATLIVRYTGRVVLLWYKNAF